MVTAYLEGLAGEGIPSKANSTCESLETRESLAVGELPTGRCSCCLRDGGNVRTEVETVGRGQSKVSRSQDLRLRPGEALRF